MVKNKPLWIELCSITVVTFVLGAVIGTHDIGYWDAGDYLAHASRGEPSGLLLGRPAFLLVSRIIIRTSWYVGIGPEHAEPLLRWFWSALSATAPALLILLCRTNGLPRATSLVAGGLLATSPSFLHVSHQVLTDGPALVCSLGALVTTGAIAKTPSARRSLAAFALLAIAVAMRETALIVAIPLVVQLRGHLFRLALSLATATLILAALMVANAGNIGIFHESLHRWIAAMHTSSVRNPLTWRDVGMSLVWLLSIGPLAFVALATIPLGIHHQTKRFPQAIWIPALIATLLLLAYPDGSFSPRYFVATAPLCVLPLAAVTLEARFRQKGWFVAAGLITLSTLTGAWLAQSRPGALAKHARARATQLDKLPNETLLVAGHPCPVLRAQLATRAAYLAFQARRTFGRLPAETHVTLLCPGWEWPASESNLRSHLDAARLAGHPIAVDIDPKSWVGPREQEGQRWSERYVRDNKAPMLGPWFLMPATGVLAY